MKKILNFLFSRVVTVALLLLVQIIVIFFTIWQLSQYTFYINVSFRVLSIFVLLHIINSRDNPSYKLAWSIPILMFPIFGGLLYYFFGGKRASKKMRKRATTIYSQTIRYLKQDLETIEEIKNQSPQTYKQISYLNNVALFPVYKNTYTEYFPTGELKFEAMKRELEKAEKFIFLEYFIIQEGVMWNSILEILKRKAQQGLDVRVLYDDMGCVVTLPYNYQKILQKYGIKCLSFNPFKPHLTSLLNNRDHRKILVIDGYIGFTGGINLADEYINEIRRFGHWKDTAIMLKGKAVENLTAMFLQLWQYESKKRETFDNYRSPKDKIECIHCKGYVLPYADSPLDNDIIGETVYLNLINNAKEYVYIYTPYLIIDNELTTALCNAALSGIDVRIVTPHIPDKWYVHMVTQAYYPQLIESGVKIYEYKPGFIHAKMFIVDGEYATVGTINMDYRSLYLHFECGVLLYKTDSITSIKQDFTQTFRKSKLITKEQCKEISGIKKILQAVLRVFSPLM